MSARVSEGWSLHDIPALVLEIAALSVTLLPELGGHVVELVVAEVRRDYRPGSSSQGRRNHVPVMFGHAAGHSRHPSTNLSIGQFRVLEREPHRGDPLRAIRGGEARSPLRERLGAWARGERGG